MRKAGTGKKLIVWLMILLTIAILLFWMFVPFIADGNDDAVEEAPIPVEAGVASPIAEF